MVSISPSLCFCARAKFNLQHFAQRSLLPAGQLQRVSSTRMKRDSHFLKSSSPLVSSLYTFHRESWNSFPATITESNPKTATRIVSFDQPQPSSPPTFCLHYRYYWHSKVPPSYSTPRARTWPPPPPPANKSAELQDILTFRENLIGNYLPPIYPSPTSFFPLFFFFVSTEM